MKNLKCRIYSIKQNNLVVAHTTEITIKDVRFKVSQKGRLKVITDKHKNVHAYAIGKICNDDIRISEKVTYNPYIHEKFIGLDNVYLDIAKYALFNNNGCFIKKIDVYLCNKNKKIMGWFGKNILDGDEPLDYLYNIAEVCGVPKNYEGDECDYITKESLEKNQTKIYNKFKKEDVGITAFQTLATQILRVGAKFEPLVYDKCVECLQKDEWAKSSIERNYHINFLLDKLKNYQNCPSEYEDVELYNIRKNDKTGADYARYVIDILKNNKMFTKDVIIHLTIIINSYSYGICAVYDESLGLEKLTKFLNEAEFEIFDAKISYISSDNFKLDV